MIGRSVLVVLLFGASLGAAEAKYRPQPAPKPPEPKPLPLGIYQPDLDYINTPCKWWECGGYGGAPSIRRELDDLRNEIEQLKNER